MPAGATITIRVKLKVTITTTTPLPTVSGASCGIIPPNVHKGFSLGFQSTLRVRVVDDVLSDPEAGVRIVWRESGTDPQSAPAGSGVSDASGMVTFEGIPGDLSSIVVAVNDSRFEDKSEEVVLDEYGGDGEAFTLAVKKKVGVSVVTDPDYSYRSVVVCVNSPAQILCLHLLRWCYSTAPIPPPIVLKTKRDEDGANGPAKENGSIQCS